MTYSMVELIRTKRDNGELSADELAWIIREYTADALPDYQLSALLMAFVLNGMSSAELTAWTDAMLHSGDVLDLAAVDKPKVDKHSTGGVGDKISISLAPVVASCGVAVPMMSGRGLGHTGGTLDKLESIPGFSVDIAPDALIEQLNDVGMVMVGQTETLVPADRRIYALRDATGTVPSIPLISSSIMSKKLAEDLDGLLLDVKVGNGAFMETEADATDLAETMVGIGDIGGTPVTAFLTNMDQPLGSAVGNANEIQESIAILKGEGPEDIRELTLLFASEMLMLAGEADIEVARSRAEAAITSGRALEVMARVTELQGGDPACIEEPSLLEIAPTEHVIKADRSGWVTACDAYAIGTAAVRLGAGRATKEDTIDPGVGFLIQAKIGDPVVEGQPLAIVSYRDSRKLDSALVAASGAWSITDEKPPLPTLVLGTVR
ncbi:MAG: pyrimidine-nucleoside phosphorylase [Acidimicrobiia bacterium]|nr:MAG: pyrimidine-nucleoside phosphorylase [Acidimicrobiia bacterium]